MFDIKNLASIKIGLVSPDTIRRWSHGEVTKSETINYSTFKPTPDGLFCEKIFGPNKDYECYCGALKKAKDKGKICPKCGVESTRRDVRRVRMGHVELSTPCTHIWYLKGTPSRIATLTGLSPKQVEEVAYYTSWVCLKSSSPKIKYGSFIDDSQANREILKSVIKDDIRPNLSNEYDIYKADAFIEALDDAQVFDFANISEFIQKHLAGMEFGQGGLAIQILLKNLAADYDANDFDDVENVILYCAYKKYVANESLDENAINDDIKKLRKGDDYIKAAYDDLAKKFNLSELDATILKELIKEFKFSRLDATILKKKKVIDELKSNNTEKPKLVKQLEILEAFKNTDNKPEWMVLDVIPIIPPDLRPMPKLDGRIGSSDLNELYRKVIMRNNKVKIFVEMCAPRTIINQQRRILQEAVDNLFDNGRRSKPATGQNGRPFKSLSSNLKGKQGRFRQNLLGKRVDFSGRSVIAVGPDLKMYQCGLPREMAVQLLRPYIAHVLIKEKGLASTTEGADEYINSYDPVVYDIVEKIISDHPVLLNRAPTLHRLGIQAFQPKLVDGRAIRLHPLVCTGFNADFDGDQMAVHLPLSKAAQYEALELMLASNNILNPKDGKPIVTPTQDMVLGNYYLTLEETKTDLLARADRRKAKGDMEEYELFTIYGNAEAKVYRNIDEVVLAYQTKQVHLHTRIAIRGSSLKKTGFTDEMNKSYMITTVGKVIFNLIFPADFPYLNSPSDNNLKGDLKEYFVPFGTDIKEYVAKLPLRAPFKKSDLAKIISEVYLRYGTSKTSAVLDKMKDQGFKYSTVAGFTISFTDIPTFSRKAEVLKQSDDKVANENNMFKKGFSTDSERHQHVVKIWEETTNQICEDLAAEFAKDRRNPIFMMQDSGARGDKKAINQLAGIRGCMSNPKGETIETPIKSSFREGLTVNEYFIGTHGARKGGADTALKTAESGYLTRKLVDVSQDVIIREVDCGCDKGFIVKDIFVANKKEPIVKLFDRIYGRFSCHEIVNPKTGEIIVPANTLITYNKANEIVDAGIKEVEIRSLFTCQTKDGVCAHCYGLNLATGNVVSLGEAVGITAAQSIGEPGTQLTMRTFNTGGVAGSDITQGLPRVKELVEARTPKIHATVAPVKGTIEKIEQKSNKYIFTFNVKDNDGKPITTESDFGARLLVKEKDKVVAGQKLTAGSVILKELLLASGEVAVQNYLIEEIQKVYSDQKISISDRHLEVIIRQMLNKVYITNPGDSDFLVNTKVDVNKFTDTNIKLEMEGKKPADGVRVVTGIARAAIESESFLSAASFQETARVLTDAATKAKTDYLHGLKENVIAGKLIPAGEGANGEDKFTAIIDSFSVKEKMKEVRQQYVETYDRPQDDED